MGGICGTEVLHLVLELLLDLVRLVEVAAVEVHHVAVHPVGVHVVVVQHVVVQHVVVQHVVVQHVGVHHGIVHHIGVHHSVVLGMAVGPDMNLVSGEHHTVSAVPDRGRCSHNAGGRRGPTDWSPWRT